MHSSLCLISSKLVLHSDVHLKAVSLCVRAYIGFNSNCNSGQNMARKLTIPQKLLQPFTFEGGLNCIVVSTLVYNGVIVIVFPTTLNNVPMYMSSCINS